MKPKIVVVGSLNMDLIARSPHIPALGETVLGSDFSTAAGGKGANQAVAAARLGAQVTMVGCVGGDDYGRQLLTSLQADGVDTQFVCVASNTHTGIALITVDDAGENSIVVVSGANWQLTQADVAAAEAAIAAADMLMLQLESPLDVVVFAAKLAARHDVPVLLNPAPARPLPTNLLVNINYLIPNESEAALLADCAVDDMNGVETAVSRLRQSGAANIIITMGSQGAYLHSDESSLMVPAFSVQPVDTTAAGDAFVAGVAVAVGEQRPLAEAVCFATAVGALATTQHGAQPSLPMRTAVQQLLNESKL
ncbi:Ribokinase [hydrothermal vent metagenome]|uniref:Ribokinase n=1 Tax=hydrothermal vent metagenome TaxID=652676 RepID=A0A3B0VPU4_9ZZZZ